MVLEDAAVEEAAPETTADVQEEDN
jgi:hypothetical protein